jgi:hypothetical protein
MPWLPMTQLKRVSRRPYALLHETPPNPHGSPTAYLWQQILQRDTWLDILGRFLHLQVTDKVDPVSDKKIRTQTMLFPRFHQWEAVTNLVEAAREQGPGRRYLIQHSGSGKTNSISWLAHRLSVLHDKANKPVFDSVIVITDLRLQVQESTAKAPELESNLNWFVIVLYSCFSSSPVTGLECGRILATIWIPGGKPIQRCARRAGKVSGYGDWLRSTTASMA